MRNRHLRAPTTSYLSKTLGRAGRRSWLGRRRFGFVFIPDICGALSERVGLCFVAHRFVGLRQIVKTSGGLGVARPARLLGKLHLAPAICLCFLILAFFAIKHAEIVESCTSLVVLL